MGKAIIILTIFAAVVGGCKNKKVPFDYGTLPSKWTALSYSDTDEYFVCNYADVITIEENELTIWYVEAGEKWITEILDAYQTGDTVVLNVKPIDNEYRRFIFKLCWEDKDKGIAQWFFDDKNSQLFVPSEKLSGFPAVECPNSLYSEEIAYTFKDFTLYPLNDTIVHDLNGDTVPEKVFFNKSENIIITDGKTETETVFDDDGFSEFGRVDYWGVTTDRETRRMLIEDASIVGSDTVTLLYPSIFVRQHYSGGGTISFDNGKYVWIHQND